MLWQTAITPKYAVNSSFSPDGLKVVVFDVDGTLYRQGPVRRAMLLRLVRSHLFRPALGWRTFRALSAYRSAQESLRADGANVATAQIRAASDRTGLSPEAVGACVERWMEQEPLQVLPHSIQPGLAEFLDACRARGLRLAALSDYPADRKLEALGIADRFELVMCAQSPEIGVFKPHPRGLQVILQRLGVRGQQCLYVGDRADVDAPAAAAAGMPCVIVNSRPAAPATHRRVADYRELHGLLFDGASGAASVPALVF